MEEQEAMALREARQPPQTARAPQLVRRQHLHLVQAVAVAAVARVLKAVAAVVVVAAVRQLHVLWPVSYVYQLAFQALQAVTAAQPVSNDKTANHFLFLYIFNSV
jgi:hypothetical protein